MCGRSSLHDAPTNILERFRLPPVIPGFRPRYNIAPSQDQWTLGIGADGAPGLRQRRWGLVPEWAKDPAVGARMINARAESLSSRPAFREAVECRRCLILADGYYEWAGAPPSRVPFFFHLAGHRAFAMAGLWERWNGGGSPLETCTVVTTDAAAHVSSLHSRMPALLDPDAAREWVSRSTPTDVALGLLRPYQGSDLEWYRVGKMVNSPANDSPECIMPAEEPSTPAVGQLTLL